MTGKEQKRRTTALLDDLADRLRSNPRLQERTEALLRGELIEGEEMANDESVMLRLPPGTKDRADQLVEPLGTLWAGVRVTRAAVLRAALIRGLDAFEAELLEQPVPKRGGARKRKPRKAKK